MYVYTCAHDISYKYLEKPNWKIDQSAELYYYCFVMILIYRFIEVIAKITEEVRINYY